MSKKYLHIIALYAIIGSLGDNSGARAITCKNIILQNPCINNSCSWNGKICEDKVNCAKIIDESPCNQQKSQCTWNKESSPPKCDPKVVCKAYNNDMRECKKYSSQCKWSEFTKLCIQRSNLSKEELCSKKWFKATCKSEGTSKNIDCVWLNSSSKTNAGQKSGCHSRSEFYETNKDYFDIEPF
ncbi:MAG: hypothetical protein KBD90_03560 [Alphaproteobacteria bacterium]|nr:hypothetical protein [Alphaproteobacteria bacterium]